VLNNPLRYTDPTGHKETECSHQSDPLCSAANGGSTGNTDGGGGNGNGKNKNKHGNDPGGDILNPNKDQDEKPVMCSSNPQGCILGGVILIVATDLTIGIPAAAVIFFTGGVTPPFGIILIKKGVDARGNIP
jgi:hypothetical protein